MKHPAAARFCALLLMLLILSGCTREPSVSESSSSPSDAPVISTPVLEEGSTSLGYFSEDSLNPYTCRTIQNFYLCGLLYDGLTALDAGGSSELRLAQSAAMDDSHWLVQLRPDAVFPNGEQVTAQDIAASFQAAAQSVYFSSSLSHVLEVQVTDVSSVTFVLDSPDALFDRCLTFPILRSDTVYSDRPIGVGRYHFTGEDQLSGNPRYYGAAGCYETIHLIGVTTLEELGTVLQTGSVKMAYFGTQGVSRAPLGVQSIPVRQSNLVFLGVNARRLNQDLRTLISQIADRETLCSSAYLGHASPTCSPIFPSYSGITSPARPGAQKIAETLDALGFDQRDAAGWRKRPDSSVLSISILTNESASEQLAAAELLAGQLQKAGIRASVEDVSPELYSARIAEGSYDLYLGETRLTPNADLLSLISPSAAYGSACLNDSQLPSLYKQVKTGELPLSELGHALSDALPVIPLLFRQGILCFSGEFSVNIVATERDIFYNIENW